MQQQAAAAEWWTAITGIAVAIFAGVQIWLERSNRSAEAKAAAAEARGYAWLARRTLESILIETEEGSITSWVTGASKSPRIDRVQEQLLTVLRLSTVAGSRHQAYAEAALEHFLTFNDALAEAFRSKPPVGRPNRDLALFTVKQLRYAIAQLEQLAPRVRNEDSPRVLDPALDPWRLTS